MHLERLSQIDEKNKITEKSYEIDVELLSILNRPGRNRVTKEEAKQLQTLKSIKNALTRFELSKNEVRVYLFLARFGAQKAQRIAEALNVHRTEAYKILRRLERQGLVSCVFERPMKFVSVPFEEALNRLIEERRQRIHMMEIWKKELLKTWETLPKPEGIIVKKETFQILEGRRQLSVKATELLNGCAEDLFMVLSDENLLWLYNSPFFEDLEEIEKERNLKTFIITNHSPTSKFVLDDVNLNNGNYLNYNLDGTPFFITSKVEMLLLMNKGYDKNSKPFAMWTNYETLVNSYMLLFSLLWDIAGKKVKKNRFSSNL